MSIVEIIAAVLIAGGLFFFLVGGVGLVRFPDFYTRLHPAGKGDTLGASLVLLGLMVHQGLTLVSAKLLFVEMFILLANPAGTHALGRAALRAGLRPWTGRPEADATQKEPPA